MGVWMPGGSGNPVALLAGLFFVLVDIEVFVGCFKGRIASQERGRMLFFIVQKPSSVWFAF